MRFSIIIPTHNESRDIGTTLRALCALDHDDFDVLVVDDSSDNTPQIVQANEDERVYYLPQTRGKGRSAARNQGILAAKGEIVVILNADVRLPSNFLRDLECHYRSGADYVLVESRVSNHLGATKHEYSNKLPKLFGTYIWDLSHGVCEPLARTFSSFPDCDWN